MQSGNTNIPDYPEIQKVKILEQFVLPDNIHTTRMLFYSGDAQNLSAPTINNGSASQSDAVLYQPDTIGTTLTFSVTMGSPYTFIPGSTVIGSAVSTVATFTATVVSSTFSTLQVTVTVPDTSGLGALTGWDFTGTYATVNYSDLKFVLNYPLRKVIYIDYTFVNVSTSFLLQIDETNQNTTVTSKGKPYWRFIDGDNFTTTVLPVKLQQQKDYNSFTFHAYNVDGSTLTVNTPWAIELIIYQLY